MPMCFAAFAGGMGWGIRGQYGHETGAMLAGLLVALVLVYFFAHHFSAIDMAKAVALATVAIGFGGSMTCLLYTSPSPRDRTRSRMPCSA